MKKILSLLITLTMVMTMIPSMALAGEDGGTTEITVGDASKAVAPSDALVTTNEQGLVTDSSFSADDLPSIGVTVKNTDTTKTENYRVIVADKNESGNVALAGNIQLLAKDTNNQWWDITKSNAESQSTLLQIYRLLGLKQIAI